MILPSFITKINEAFLVIVEESVCHDKSFTFQLAFIELIECFLYLQFGTGIVPWCSSGSTSSRQSMTLVILAASDPGWYCLREAPCPDLLEVSGWIPSFLPRYLHEWSLHRLHPVSKADVVSYGSALDPGILQHHTKAVSKGMSGYLPDVLSIHQDLSFIYIIESHQQVDKCRLTASVGPTIANTHTRFTSRLKFSISSFFIITKCHIVGMTSP